MLAAMMLAACLAPEFEEPQLVLAVARVAPLSPGDPLVLHATVVYRGERVIRVSNIFSAWSGHTTLPAGLNAREKPPSGEPRHSVFIGSPTSSLRPGEALSKTIDLGVIYDLSALAPGKHTICVRAYLSVMDAADSFKVVGNLRSLPVEVPIEVVARPARK